MSDFLDEEETRIAAILFPGKKVKELPDVTLKHLQTYSEYLKKKLPKGLLLTGRESVGYFDWEESFEWDDDRHNKEYEKLRKERASYRDKFLFMEVKMIDPEDNIVVTVSRVTDQKIFDIPLHDLAVCPSEEFSIVDDYGFWVVNYEGAWVKNHE